MAVRESNHDDTIPHQMYGFYNGTIVRLKVNSDGSLTSSSSVVQIGWQSLYDYQSRTDGQAVYIGLALTSALTSEDAWDIWRYYYDTDGFVTKIDTRKGIWDNRTSLF